MAKSIFASFHYDNDNFRVQQVLNMGAIEADSRVTAQDWETVKRQTDAAIERWIHTQMLRKEAVVVLIGSQTSARRWVDYEIRKAWDDRRPMVGVHISGLKNSGGQVGRIGANPFAGIKTRSGATLDRWVPVYKPIGADSRGVYKSISDNIETWISSAYSRAS